MVDFAVDVWAALVSLALGTLLGREVARWMDRPRVIVRYRELSPLHTKDGTFWSIRVVNLGRTVAERCVGRICLFDIDPSNIIAPSEADANEWLPEYAGEPITLDFPRSQVLARDTFRQVNGSSICWAQLGNPAEVNINPGTIEALDVCKVQQVGSESYIIFPTEKGWRQLRMRLRAQNLKGRILVCPANEYPTPIDFEIRVGGKGDVTFHPHPLRIREKLRLIFLKGRFYYP